MLTWLFQEIQVRASEKAQQVSVIVAKLDDLSLRKHVTEGEKQVNKEVLNFCMQWTHLINAPSLTRDGPITMPVAGSHSTCS